MPFKILHDAMKFWRQTQKFAVQATYPNVRLIYSDERRKCVKNFAEIGNSDSPQGYFSAQNPKITQ